MFEFTEGTQCCLRCGRVLTDRVLHDSFEEAALEGLRAGRGGGGGGDAAGAETTCEPCVSDFRRLLLRRRKRSARRLKPTARAGSASSRLTEWLRGMAEAF